jgi:dihydrofolate reductase
MLFDAIFDSSFRKDSFQPHENYSRDLFRAFFAQKVVFGRVTYGPFVLEFLTVYNYHNRKGKILSSQREKQNEASLSGSNYTPFLYTKISLRIHNHMQK